MNRRKAALLARRRELEQEIGLLVAEKNAINLHLGFYEDLDRLDDRIGLRMEWIEGHGTG